MVVGVHYGVSEAAPDHPPVHRQGNQESDRERDFLGFEPSLGYRPKVLDGDLFAPVDGFVADHDPDDVAVAPREIDGGFDLFRSVTGPRGRWGLPTGCSSVT